MTAAKSPKSKSARPASSKTVKKSTTAKASSKTTPAAVKKKSQKEKAPPANPALAPSSPVRSVLRVGAQVKMALPPRPTRPLVAPPLPQPITPPPAPKVPAVPAKTAKTSPAATPKAPKTPEIQAPAAPAAMPKPVTPAAPKAPVAPVQPAAPVKAAPAAPPPVYRAPTPPPSRPSAPYRPAPAPHRPAAPKPAVPAPVAVVEFPKSVALKFPITVKEMAEKMGISSSEIIKRLLGMKIMATINQSLTQETAAKVLEAMGVALETLPTLEEELTQQHEQPDDPKQLKPRPPVVTLMGHVDHGKTSLLDAIRKSKVTESESGGITQHIGAYQVHLPKGWITFLDTPGHEAFTAMRARGAHVTDVVILVVAADDGVMPQTVEAIDHAKAAGATIVVAMNKVDKPEANAEKVKRQLMEHGLMTEDWGGKTVMVPVSARTGQGIDELLEIMLLEAELLELKANPTRSAKGIVIEAELSKGGGPVATVLVQNGSLKVSDIVVAGSHYGRVRAMINDHGQRVQSVGPSMPVEILGLGGVPKAGEPFYVVDDERKARELTQQRQETLRQAGLSAGRKVMTLEEFQNELKAGKIKELNLIVKADVQGSIEAIKASMEKLSTDKVQLKILHAGVGAINESDVMLAVASNAIVIGFHVTQTPEGEVLAKEEKVDVRLYEIIYEAIEEIRAAMEGLLEPKLQEIFVGRAKVLQVFKLTKAGSVAGCQVVKGKMIRSATFRLMRDNQKVFEGKISSLKRFKDDVREVGEGLECGIALQGFNDYQEGDLIEAFEIQQVAQKL